MAEPKISGCNISHDQYYLIPENVEDGDDVGVFHYNYVYDIFNDSSGNYSFSIFSGNDNSIYAIDGSSGMISIDVSSVTSGTDTLSIKIIVDDASEVNNAFITVIPESSCHFADPIDGSVNYDGTRATPKQFLFNFNSAHTTGHAYFMKRDTSQNNTGTFLYNYVDGTYYGAYGTEEKPILDGQGIRLGEWDTSDGMHNVKIFDIHVRNSRIDTLTNDCYNEYHRTEHYGANSNGGIYIYAPYEKDSSSKVYDCFSEMSLSHGYKLGNGFDCVNVRSTRNKNNGITTQGGNSTFTYCFIHDNSSLYTYGIELNRGNNTPSWIAVLIIGLKDSNSSDF